MDDRKHSLAAVTHEAIARRNLEAKFPLRDRERARERALGAGFALEGVFAQRDTFFVVPNGKLKLREEPDGARLIHYRRIDRDGLKVSDYAIVPIADPERTRTMLDAALGVLAEVRKQRTLLLRDDIRLHLDRVEGLGDFGEIEAVMPAQADPEPSRAAVDSLLDALGVSRDELIDVSYFEMMKRG
jgi:adenylate cyclase, class 2